MKTWIALVSSWLLAACALGPSQPSGDSLLADGAFARSSTPIRADDVFASSEAMRRYVREEIAGAVEAKGRQRALYDALYNRGQLRLEYDSEITRNAAEAF